LNRAECKAACSLHLIILNRCNISIKQKKVGVCSARSIKSCIRPGVRQVVFTDVRTYSKCLLVCAVGSWGGGGALVMGVGGGAACLLGLFYLSSRATESNKSPSSPQRQEMALNKGSDLDRKTTTIYHVSQTRGNGAVVKYVGTDPVIRDNLDSIAAGILEEKSQRQRRTASREPEKVRRQKEATAALSAADSCKLPLEEQEGPRVEYWAGEVVDQDDSCKTLRMSINVSAAEPGQLLEQIQQQQLEKEKQQLEQIQQQQLEQEKQQLERQQQLEQEKQQLERQQQLEQEKQQLERQQQQLEQEKQQQLEQQKQLEQQQLSQLQQQKFENHTIAMSNGLYEKKCARRARKIEEAREEIWEEPDFSAKTKTFKITKASINVVFNLEISGGIMYLFI
jgi:hypothetical protein